MVAYETYLERATTAAARGDYLTTLQLALRAARQPDQAPDVRCDAYLLLAIAAAQLELAEEALAYAVGAHLSACWAHDEARERQASSVVAMIMATYPGLGQESPSEGAH